MDDADFAALVEDVRVRGVQQPITLYHGEIADGWHRARACVEAGRTDCPAVDFQGDYMELVAHVESLNRHRRHVPSRKAIALAVARVRVSADAPADDMTVGQVADSLGVSKIHYQRALRQAREEQGIEQPPGGRPRSEPEGESRNQEGAPPAVPTGTRQSEAETGPDIPAQTGIPQDPADFANPAGDIPAISPPPEVQLRREAQRVIERLDGARRTLEDYRLRWGPAGRREDVQAAAELLRATCEVL